MVQVITAAARSQDRAPPNGWYTLRGGAATEAEAVEAVRRALEDILKNGCPGVADLTAQAVDLIAEQLGDAPALHHVELSVGMRAS